MMPIHKLLFLNGIFKGDKFGVKNMNGAFWG